MRASSLIELGDLMATVDATLADALGTLAPTSFLVFCEDLSVKLTPAQRVIGAVAYDRVEPRELEPGDRELARDLFGDVDRFAEGARDVIVGVCGARGGKSYVLGALRILHLALTVPLTALAPGEVASAPLIAPDKDLAGQALSYVKGAIASSSRLAALVRHETTESIEIGREGGRVVEIVCRAASAKGRTGRGRSLVGAVMDEAAFFLDASYKVNDEEVFRALTPRILPGGQLAILSTPYAQAGLLYQQFADNHPDPSVAGLTSSPSRLGTALAIHAPTLTLRDEPQLRAVIERERARDPENADREYEARFLSASSATFFDPASIDRAIDETLVMPRKPEAGDVVTSGADMGFAKNSSALAVTHRRGSSVALAELLEKKPEGGEPLKPSVVTKEFAWRVAWHRGSYVMADAHYRETVREHLVDVGLAFLDAPSDPAEAFIATQLLLREGRLKIPNHPKLLRQMREVMCRRGSGGRVIIVLPKWRTGEHGDLVSALVLAAYQAAGAVVAAEKPVPGTREAREVEARERMLVHIERLKSRSETPWQLRSGGER